MPDLRKDGFFPPYLWREGAWLGQTSRCAGWKLREELFLCIFYQDTPHLRHEGHVEVFTQNHRYILLSLSDYVNQKA